MIYRDIENLLAYAMEHLLLDPRDLIYKRNTLYDVLNLKGKNDLSVASLNFKDLMVPDGLLTPIIDFAVKNNYILEDEKEHFISRIMGLLTLNPSQMEDYFFEFKEREDATNWFYQYCIYNRYIDYNKINQNMVWETKKTKHPLTITINLTKPEKTNEEVKELLELTKTTYPASLLAKENVGFNGTKNYPARQNIRTIPVKLGNEPWFWQYSPYGYFNEHLIVINEKVTPMIVNEKTIDKLMDFVIDYPHYFVGVNASLPIVGGSILNHEHFQGGKYNLPMFKAFDKVVFSHPSYVHAKVSILDWYNSTVRICASNLNHVKALAKEVLHAWKEYTNEALDILGFANDIPHNSAAIIIRKQQGMYIAELILRNNRTDDVYPQGIFHAHPEYFHIKQEGIGLIEAMGVFILPTRLKRQLEIIANILKDKKYNQNDLSQDMLAHHDFIQKLLIETKTQQLSFDEALEYVYQAIDLICEQILINTAVFKPNGKHLKHFIAFLSQIGLNVELRGKVK